MPSPGEVPSGVAAALRALKTEVDRLARRLYDLAHLDQSGATDGQVPTWDDSAGQWVPGDVVSAVVIPVLHGDPSSPAEGMIWFNLDATC